jgi:hypothetical protein
MSVAKYHDRMASVVKYVLPRVPTAFCSRNAQNALSLAENLVSGIRPSSVTSANTLVIDERGWG